MGGYPALVVPRQGLTGAQQDQAAVSLQGEQGGLLRVEDPGPHGDDLAGGLVRPGPDPRHAACKCCQELYIILSYEVNQTIRL